MWVCTTGSWLATLVHCREVESTSSLAAALLREGSCPLPLLVWADRQSGGRGRGDNAWYSDPGSLTVTLALDPRRHDLGSRHWPQVALAVAVSVIDVVARLDGPAGELGIRWPNDVEARGRKLAGILPELIDTPYGQRLAIGLGLNLATQFDQAPDEVKRLGVSLHTLGFEGVSPEAWLRAWLELMPGHIDALAQGASWLPERWRQSDLLTGQPLRVRLGDDQFVTGSGAGISPRGELLVDTGKERLSLVGGQVLRD